MKTILPFRKPSLVTALAALAFVTASGLAFNASATTYTYSGAPTAMLPSQTLGNDSVVWNTTGGYFNNANATIIYTNANLTFTSLVQNNGYSGSVTIFSSGTTVTGAGTFSLNGPGGGQDWVFAGNMTGYSGNVSITNSGSSGSALGSSANSVVQYGGTNSGGTVALGSVTGASPNRYINNVSGTGTISGNNLVFNYGTNASYDFLKINNSSIATRYGLYNLGNADIQISGVISGGGALNQLGAGTLTLAGTNIYSGSTIVNNGVLIIAGGGGLYRNGYFGSPVVTVNAGGTLALQNWQYDTTIGSLGGLTANPGHVVVNGGTIQMNNTSATSYGRGVNVSVGGATLDANGSALWTIDTTHDSNPWNYAGNPTLTLTGSGNGQFQKDITSGTGGLVKSGAGTWTLTGSGNNYTGSTVISNGTLAVSGRLIGGGAVALEDNAALNIIVGASATISSASSLTLGGGGAGTTLAFDSVSKTVMPIMATNLTVNSTTTVNVTGQILTTGQYPLIQYASESGTGSFAVGSLPAGVTATVVDDHSSTVYLNVSVVPVVTEVWSGSPNGTWDVGTTANWLSGAVASTWTDGSVAQFDDTAAGTTAVALSTTVNPVAVNFLNATKAYSISGSGAIAGAGALTLNGGGTVTLNTINSYSGGTVVENGSTLSASQDASLGTGGVTLDNGLLDLTGSTAIASGKSLTLGAGNGTIQADNTAGVSLTSAITGGGALTKGGAGTLSLSGQSTFTGGTTVNAGVLDLTGGGGQKGAIRGTATINTGGTLRLSTGDAVGYGGGAAALTVINIVGGTLDVNTTANQTLGSAVINLTGGAITGIAGGNLDFFGGGSALNTLASGTTATISGTAISPLRQGSTTFNVAAGTTPGGIDLDISSVLRESPSGDAAGSVLIKANAGTMRLSAVNTYAGGTEVQGGKLILSGRLTGGGGVTVDDGTEMDVYSAGTKSAIANAASLILGASGSLTLGFVNFINTNTPVITTANLTNNGTVTVSVSGVYAQLGQFPLVTYTGVSAGAGSFVLGALPPGVTATLVNDLAGASKTLYVDISAAPLLPTLTWAGFASGAWDVNATANWTTNGVDGVAYQNPDRTLFDDTATTTAVTLDTGVTPLSVTFSNSTQNYTLSGSGSIAGDIGLTKNGSGTVTLANTNTYTGETVVNAGTLQLNDAPLSTSDITNSGAVVYNTTTNQSVGYLISGAGTVTKTGTGTLTITQAGQAITGGLNVNGGTLRAFGGGWATSFFANVSPRAITVNTNGVLETQTHSLGGLGGSFYQPVITVNDGGVWQLDGAQYLNGNNLVLQGATVMIAVNDSLRLQGGTVTVNAASQPSTILTGTNSGTITLYGNTTFNVADGAAATDLSVTAVISSSGANGITKAGAGVMTLTTNETYTGNTTVSGGTLALGGGGSIASSTNLTIGAGADLDVSTITASGYSPNASGTLTVGIDKTSNVLTQGQVQAGGKSLTYVGNLAVTKTGSGALAAGDSFPLFVSTGGYSGNFSSLTLPTLASGLAWDTNDLANSGVLDVYAFTATSLTLATPTNTAATIAALKLANHVSSGKLAAAYPASGWTAAVTTAPANGTAAFDGGGDLTYTPNTNYAGPDSFTVTFNDGHGSQTLAVSVSVGTGNGLSPNLLVSGVNGGNFVLQFAGIPGTEYTVETNSVLDNSLPWVKLGNFTTPANGIIGVTNSMSGASSLFYRTVYPSY